jgi:hypothetical protein
MHSKRRVIAASPGGVVKPNFRLGILGSSGRLELTPPVQIAPTNSKQQMDSSFHLREAQRSAMPA